MHAFAMLHRALAKCCPHIHAKRLTCLCAAAHGAVSGFPLTLSALGRAPIPYIPTKRQCDTNLLYFTMEILNNVDPDITKALPEIWDDDKL